MSIKNNVLYPQGGFKPSGRFIKLEQFPPTPRPSPPPSDLPVKPPAPYSLSPPLSSPPLPMYNIPPLSPAKPQTWWSFSLSSSSINALSSVAAADNTPNYSFIAATGRDSGIYTSRDGGATFSKSSAPAASWYAITSSRCGTVCGYIMHEI